MTTYTEEPFGAAQVTSGNNETLSHTVLANEINSALGFTLAGWLKWTSGAGVFYVKIGGLSFQSVGSFVLDDQGVGGGYLFLSAEPGDFAPVMAGGTNYLADNNWHFVVSWYDPITRKITIQIDNSITSTSPTGMATDPPFSGNKTVTFGSNPLTGSFDEFGLWNRVLSATERSFLYNAHNGRDYSDLSAANRASLIAYWSLNEVSGTREDLHGIFDLTDNNTVSFTDGVVGDVVVGGIAVDATFYLPSGSILGGGTATVTNPYSPTITGGSLVAGVSDVLATYEPDLTGGSICGGQAEVANPFNPATSGGALAGGISEVGEAESVSGGAVGAGVAEISEGELTSGGAVSGGDSTITCVYTGVVSGGGVVNKWATFTYDYTTTGGIVAAGAAVDSDAESVDGGAALAGAAIEAHPYRPNVYGGVKLGGSAYAIGNRCRPGFLCKPKRSDSYCDRMRLIQSQPSRTGRTSKAYLPSITRCRERA